jgi:hypothetical protein
MLLVLFSAPAQVALADPDAVTPQQERLVEVVRTTSTSADLRLTSEGKALLQRLGLMSTLITRPGSGVCQPGWHAGIALRLPQSVPVVSSC